MTENSILLELLNSLFTKNYNDHVIFLANQSANQTNLLFVGVLSGGNLDFTDEVLSESLSQLCNDIKSGRLQEALWC